MPTVEVPLQSWTDIQPLKKSKRFKKQSDEAVALAALEKLIKARRSELSLELHDMLDDALPEHVKSVEYDHTEITRERVLDVVLDLLPEELKIESATITKKAGGKSSRFDKQALMSTPIPCSNPKCRTENHVTVDIIEACTKYGERRPGVSITLPGEENENA